jgi:FG-GAP-like repeat/Cep192 domain 4/HYDIN/CFA65/VesB-like, Ig-like domain
LEWKPAGHSIRQRLATNSDGSAANIATASTGWVTVVTPAPGGGRSNVAFFSVRLPASSVAFQRTDYTAAYGSESVAIGDFNADGALDLAVSDFWSATLSTLLGNGNGTFQSPTNYRGFSQPETLVVGDFNGDGKQDLAVTDSGTNTVWILLGNGNETFQPANGFAKGAGFSRMVAGDFNGDGRLDLATTNYADGTVSILLGNGDGTFRHHVDYPVGQSITPITVGDVNGDGKLDLLVGDAWTATYAVLLGNGDGTFKPYISYPTIANPQSLVLADFNGDGKLDLAVFSETSGNTGLQILLGNGDGTFQSFATYATGCGPDTTDCSATVADLNGDNRLDLVVRNAPTDTVSVLLGNGDGTFQGPLTFATGPQPQQVMVGDFNGDGQLDLAVTSGQSSSVSVLLQFQTGPAATLFPSSLTFGPQLVGTKSTPQSVTLTNTGGATLDINSIAASGNFRQTNNCGSSLAVGASCTITVFFKPYRVGTITGTLTITDNAPNSPQTVSLSGVGTAVTLLPSSLDFGDQPVGTTSPPQTVTFTNYATRVLSIQGIRIAGTNPGSFAQTNTCGTSVPAGGNCTISVTFTPKRKGQEIATLHVSDNGGASPQTVALSGNGT